MSETKTYAWSDDLHAYVPMSFSPNEAPSKLSFLEVEIDIQESAGLGSRVLVRMLRLTIIGHGGGYTGAVGAGGHGDITASGGTERT